MYKRVNELLETKYKSDSEIDWKDISSNYTLSESFIREFQDKVDWEYISTDQVLSESFIEDFKDSDIFNGINKWGAISGSQLLSWNFILKYSNFVSWDFISLFQPFIEDPNYEKINKKLLIRNKLYHLYQETKDRGWFIGYVEDDFDYRIYWKYFNINPDIYFNIRSKIYWKDLVTTSKVKYFEPIRTIKYV